jgi:maleylacetate reductase
VRAFVYSGLPARVVFGPGTLDQLGVELERLGIERALVLCTPRQRALAEDVARRIGSRTAGIFDGAVMHVPVETAAAAHALAMQLGADGCVAIGGGTAIGLGKAIALAMATAGNRDGPVDLTDSPGDSLPRVFPILAIPTTFSGSEMTPIHGTTARGQKKTGRDPRVLPRAVIYDPQLLMALPARVVGPSGMNAVAHCVEALWAADANPITSLVAEEGIRALGASLPRVVQVPDDREARAEALYGAWLAGTALGAVTMGLHHRLCHILGGRFNLSHAETHAVLLPQVVAFNRAAAPEAMARIGRALGQGHGLARDPAQALFELGRGLGISMALADLARDEVDLGAEQIRLTAGGLDEATRLVLQQAPPANPRPIEYPALRQLLDDAWNGRPPSAQAPTPTPTTPPIQPSQEIAT